MKQISTLIQRITAMAVVLVMALNINAADRTFATIEEMNAATDLASGDKVTITGDVVVEYIMNQYYVLKDKNGTATCVNYDYYFNKFQQVRLEGLEEYPETPPVKPGDVFKGYTAKVGFSNGMLQLDPDLDMDNVEFNGFTAEYAATDDYVINATKVTVRQLLDEADKYVGKVVSLDFASTYAKGFNTYLVQGTDTLTNFRIYGLDVYPNSLVINHALCLPKYGGGCKLEMMPTDYEVGAFTSVKAIKESKMIANIPLNITAQVMRKEVYEGKTYITIVSGEGTKLLDYSGIRVLLNTENDVDKAIKVGDVITLKADAAQLAVYARSSAKHTLSLLTVDAHETTIVENKTIQYLPISPEEISMLEYYEYLPVTLDGFVTLKGEPTADQTAHNVAPAILTTQFGDVTELILDLTYMPKGGEEFIVSGIIDIPMWQGSAAKPTIVPLAAKDFMSTSYTFENIAAMFEMQETMVSIVNYGFANPLVITGVETIEAVGDEDQAQNVIFVADETGCLMLKGSVEAKVGDAISAVSGYYSAGRANIVSEDGFIDFGVATSLVLDTTGVEIVESSFVPSANEVVISQLLASDEYTSRIVTLSDFTYGTVEETVQDVTVTRHFLYQGSDSIAVDESFADFEDKSTLNAIYYLNGFYTRLIPYTGKLASSETTAVDDVLTDNVVYVENSVVYAQGAEIEVYDVMGRMIATGVDAVSLESANQSVFVVRTKYADGQMFVTKVANR